MGGEWGEGRKSHVETVALLFPADKMSVRTGRPPAPRSKPPPPPPTFAPPPLPKTPSLNVYKRNEKINSSEKDDQEVQISALPPKFKIEEVNISELVQAPKLIIEESLVSETVNFTLKPRSTNKITRKDRDDQQIPSQ